MFVVCFTCLWLERRKECEAVNILSTMHSGPLFSFCSQKTKWESVLESIAPKENIEDFCRKGWSFSWKISQAHFDQQLNNFISIKNIFWGCAGRSQDGGGIGRGDDFLFYKFIERTTERWTKFTKQLLIASNGHQTPRKAAHCLRRESSNTPLLFLNFHFHLNITLQKKRKKKKRREREALFLNWTPYISLNLGFLFLFLNILFQRV